MDQYNTTLGITLATAKNSIGMVQVGPNIQIRPALSHSIAMSSSETRYAQRLFGIFHCGRQCRVGVIGPLAQGEVGGLDLVPRHGGVRLHPIAEEVLTLRVPCGGQAQPVLRLRPAKAIFLLLSRLQPPPLLRREGRHHPPRLLLRLRPQPPLLRREGRLTTPLILLLQESATAPPLLVGGA